MLGDSNQSSEHISKNCGIPTATGDCYTSLFIKGSISSQEEVCLKYVKYALSRECKPRKHTPKEYSVSEISSCNVNIIHEDILDDACKSWIKESEFPYTILHQFHEHHTSSYNDLVDSEATNDINESHFINGFSGTLSSNPSKNESSDSFRKLLNIFDKHIEKIIHHRKDKRLFLVVSLSGGVDSVAHMALLRILQIRKYHSIKISALFLGYRNREDYERDTSSSFGQHDMSAFEKVSDNEMMCTEKELSLAKFISDIMGVDLYYHIIELSRPHAGIRTGIDRHQFEDWTRKIRFKMYKDVHDMMISSWFSSIDIGNRVSVLEPLDISVDMSIPYVIVGHHLDDVDENRIAELGKRNALYIDGMCKTQLMTTSPHTENNIELDIDSSIHICVARPLLDARKSDIIEAVKYLRIPYLKDSTPYWSRRGYIRRIIDSKNGHDIKNALSRVAGLSSRLVEHFIGMAPSMISELSITGTSRNSPIVVDFLKIRYLSQMFLCDESELSKIISSFRENIDELSRIWNIHLNMYARTGIDPEVSVKTEELESLIHKMPIERIDSNFLDEKNIVIMHLLLLLQNLFDSDRRYRVEFFCNTRPTRRSVSHVVSCVHMRSNTNIMMARLSSEKMVYVYSQDNNPILLIPGRSSSGYQSHTSSHHYDVSDKQMKGFVEKWFKSVTITSENI